MSLKDKLNTTLDAVVIFGGGFVVILVIVTMIVVVAVTPTLVALWLAGSLATSGIKVAQNDCGTTYQIEEIVSGDWFCPEKVVGE